MKNQWNTQKRKLKISKMKILEEHEIEKSVRNWCRNSVTSWVKNLWQFVSVKNTKRYLFWKINGYNLWPLLNRWDLRLTKIINFIIILLLLCFSFFYFFFYLYNWKEKNRWERENNGNWKKNLWPCDVKKRGVCSHATQLTTIISFFKSPLLFLLNIKLFFTNYILIS
jgi:hypothetical protein